MLSRKQPLERPVTHAVWAGASRSDDATNVVAFLDQSAAVTGFFVVYSPFQPYPIRNKSPKLAAWEKRLIAATSVPTDDHVLPEVMLSPPFQPRNPKGYQEAKGASYRLLKMKTYLQVAFHESLKVKALGARFDMSRKQWFVPDGVDLIPFLRWVPNLPKLKKSVRKLLEQAK